MIQDEGGDSTSVAERLVDVDQHLGSMGLQGVLLGGVGSCTAAGLLY